VTIPEEEASSVPSRTVDPGIEVIAHVADITSDPELDRAAFNELAEPALVVDEEVRIVRVNNEATLFLGYTRLELLGQRIEILVPEMKRDVHQRVHVPRYLLYPQNKQMGSRTEDLAIRTKPGREIPVRISLKPFTISTGRYTNVTIRLKEETRG